MVVKRIQRLQEKAKLLAKGVVLDRQQNAAYNRIQALANGLLAFYLQREGHAQ